METILHHLETWGCDVPGALERLAGDTNLYVSCLRMFTADKGFSQLRAALECQDMRAAFEAAHMLKGVAANLGLAPLLHPVSALVEELRANRTERLASLFGQVEDARRKLGSIVAA
ncbi:MAG: Hpt domain-containing protein [Desulfovibrionaceae bacterium]|nr:Hpt domain-containing protein [Desulfovibrionaceae bacterium]